MKTGEICKRIICYLQDTNDLLWWGIVGHTEQLLSVKCQAGKYVMANSDIRDHVSRSGH